MKCNKLLWGGVSAAALLLTAGPALAQDQLETVVVTGIRASLEKGLEVKRQSTQVVESIIAEDIGKLPDNNVVEALQRISGVQVTDRGSGQVGTLTIRGMTDVETSWNGRKLFTASGQYFSVQDMPATMVSRLDVYKTREAGQIETGIAGQLDVSTHRPFDFDGFKFSAQALGTYQELRGSFDPNISLLVSDRWDTKLGKFGALMNLSWATVRYRDESATPGALVPFATEAGAVGAHASSTCDSNWGALERIQPTDCRAPGQQIWQPGLKQGLSEQAGATMSINGNAVPYYLSRDAVFQSDQIGKRTRPNANVSLQWQPSDKALYTFEVMYNGFRNQNYNNMLFSFVDWWGDFSNGRISPASSYTLYDGTNVMKTRHVGNVYGFNSGDMTLSKTDSQVYALNALWTISDRFTVTGDATYQTSRYYSQFQAMRIERTAPDINVDFNSGNGYLAFNFGDGQGKLTDPTAWNTAQLYDNANSSQGAAYTLMLDGTYDLDGQAYMLKKLRFGIRYDDRNASESYRQASGYHAQNFATMPAEAYWYNKGFFDGKADVPTSWVNVDGRYVYEHLDELRQTYGGELTNARLHEMFKTFHIDEVNTTAYVEGDLEQDVLGHPLKLNAGVRWVQIKDTTMFWNRNTFLIDGSHELHNGSGYSAAFLPSATLSYEPTDDVKVRLNYGETLRRPGFSSLNPTQILNADVTKVGYGTGSQGNPNLKPTHSKNIDLSAEWYFAPNSAIYGTLFRRDITGLVVTMNNFTTIDGAAIKSSYNTNDFIINKPMNASAGHLQGIEAGFVYFPDFLPSLMDGLGLQGSTTILSSQQNVPQSDTKGNVTGELTQQFFGVSNLSFNSTLIYEKDNFGARLSYVWRSKFLNAYEAASFANPLGIWRKPESSLDMQLSYKLTDRMMVSFDAVNLLKSSQQQYYQLGGQGSPQVTDFGTLLFSRSFTIGLRYETN